MLATVVDILSWAALLGGGFFYVVGAVGLNRMPDVFSRMHAVSVSESLGVGLLILGMALQAGFTLVTVKLFIILVVTGSPVGRTSSVCRPSSSPCWCSPPPCCWAA